MERSSLDLPGRGSDYRRQLEIDWDYSGLLRRFSTILRSMAGMCTCIFTCQISPVEDDLAKVEERCLTYPVSVFIFKTRYRM